MNELDLDMRLVMYARWSNKHVAVYNEFLKRWEPILEFRSNNEREEFMDSLPKQNKTTMKDYPNEH